MFYGDSSVHFAKCYALLVICLIADILMISCRILRKALHIWRKAISLQCRCWCHPPQIKKVKGGLTDIAFKYSVLDLLRLMKWQLVSVVYCWNCRQYL